MKRWLTLVLALGAFYPAWRVILLAADANEEQKLIQVLQSAASPAEKDAACARLKLIGTTKCVPALAVLLTDDQLSHSARYALEPMPFDEAGGALLDAMGKTKGPIRVGIINSLGFREEKRAVPALAALVRDPDLAISSASASALGRIGGSDALTALRGCLRNSPPVLHAAAADGLLRCANRLLASSERASALAIFEQLYNSAEKDSIRVAAFKGRVRASGNAGLGLMVSAVSGPADPAQTAALQLVRDLQVPNTTSEMAKLLPGLTPAVQSALVEGLAQRGDHSAAPALAALAGSAVPEVRVPIIRALEALDDASVVPLLAGFAASGSAQEQKAARQALTDLRRGNVTETLIDQLSARGSEVQAELARALGSRGDKAAIPKLLDLAQRGSGSVRISALRALSALVDESQLGALVDFVLQAKDQSARSQASEALNSAYQRIISQHGHAEVTPLLEAFEKGPNEARASLLPICGGLVDPRIRTTLRVALGNEDPRVKAAAVHALSDTIDPELLQDLVNLARSTQEDAFRTLAIVGGVRLVTQEETVKIAPAQRVAVLKSFMTCASRPEQKREVLAGLGEVPDAEALGVIETALDDNSVRNEAARAATKVSAALPRSQAQLCEATLKKALAAANDEGTRQAVQAALKQIQDKSNSSTSSSSARQ